MLESAFYAILAIAVLGVFLWLVFPSQSSDAQPPGEEAVGDAEGGATVQESGRPEADLEVGLATGLVGGSVEDAAIARYALSRTPPDPASSPARDLGTAIGMQESTSS